MQWQASTAFDGVAAHLDAAFLGKKESGGRELQDILSPHRNRLRRLMPLQPFRVSTKRYEFAEVGLSNDPKRQALGD